MLSPLGHGKWQWATGLSSPDAKPTSAEAAERVWKDKNPGWRHPQHAQEWMSSLSRHALPDLGNMPVSDISSAEVLDALRGMWHVRPATARRVRQRISAVMDWAIAMQFRTDNPCDRLGSVLGPQQDQVQHMRALPHGEVAAAIRAVRGSGATKAVKLASEFLVLTAARSGEVRGARWAEIGGKAGVWTIPATRMTAKREHCVPLCGRGEEWLSGIESLLKSMKQPESNRGGERGKAFWPFEGLAPTNALAGSHGTAQDGRPDVAQRRLTAPYSARMVAGHQYPGQRISASLAAPSPSTRTR